MDQREKAFVYGSIQARIEEEKKHIPKNSPRKGGRRR
jgi:hypothetical protein